MLSKSVERVLVALLRRSTATKDMRERGQRLGHEVKASFLTRSYVTHWFTQFNHKTFVKMCFSRYY